jgi:hypothetical protein
MGDRYPDAMLTQILTDLVATVSFVSTQTAWPALWSSSSPRVFNSTLLHQASKGCSLMPLTRGEDKDYRLAPAFCSNVYLGAESTLAVTKSFCGWVPLFAPAAC